MAACGRRLVRLENLVQQDCSLVSIVGHVESRSKVQVLSENDFTCTLIPLISRSNAIPLLHKHDHAGATGHNTFTFTIEARATRRCHWRWRLSLLRPPGQVCGPTCRGCRTAALWQWRPTAPASCRVPLNLAKQDSTATTVHRKVRP